MSDPRLAPLDASFAPARAEFVYTVEIDGEAVLLDESVNRLHLLNATAALVWRLLDGDVTIGEMATELSEELGTPYDAVLADTLEVIRKFGEQGLLAGVAAAP
jgi:predicted ATPase